MDVVGCIWDKDKVFGYVDYVQYVVIDVDRRLIPSGKIKPE